MRQTLDFLLNDWLDAASLLQRPRFAEHSAQTFASVLDTCERIAAEKYAPFNRLADTQEPHVVAGPDGDRVQLPASTHAALAAYVDSGMLAAAQDFEIGGMQLPCVIEMAANAFFSKASVAMGGYAMLTSGNASLLMAHGTPLQRKVFAQNEFSGRWFGTMCLSEPQAGSSLSDVATRAVPDGDDFAADALGPRYRLRGNKMWISAGEHEITENIVHLVLAKIPGADGQTLPGTRGISLFIVPKHLVNERGELTGVRNDVALAGLNHKLGYRGTTNTLLNFGEGRFPVGGASGGGLDGRGAGAVGYLVGQPGQGLRCMFHMMNEARIGVGLGARATKPAWTTPGSAHRGARSSLKARTLRSHRSPSSNTPTSSACCWRRRVMSKAAWRWPCTARGWSMNSTPATPLRRPMQRCCWKC
jgi:alkylation response protein AidB-like acyl-CoA dehydrogenase